MIIGDFKSIEKYCNLISGLSEALDAINSMNEIKTGRYDLIKGYFFVQEGYTKFLEDQLFETHRKYIDVQILLEGQEVMEWSQVSKLTIDEKYNEEKDIELYQGKGTQILIEPQSYYILFPEDAHKACGHLKEQSKYFKIVVKLPACEND